MKQGLTASLFIAGVVCSSVESAKEFSIKKMLSLKETSEGRYMGEFLKFIADYGKSYSSKDQFEARYLEFEKQMTKVQEHNSQNGILYQLGLNQFSDWTEEEYKKLLGSRPKLGDQPYIRYLDTSNLSSSIDWRTVTPSVLNPVKDQGQCGSCWSFDAAGSIESHYAIQHGKLYSLSEQQQMDCSQAYDNYGCNGGYHDDAFLYAIDFGLEQEADYPYLAVDGPCNYDKSKVVVYVDVFYNVPTQDVDQLKAALAFGPVSVSIDGSDTNFRNYQSGILTNCLNNLNHGVIVVGYGQDSNANQYWIVRNSWGPNWGQNGYINIGISSTANNGTGVCGIQTRPSYPFTKSA